MRNPGLFYDPSVHDYGSKAVAGGLAGLAMVQRGQDIQANKMKMDEAKKMQAVKDEIAAAYKSVEGDLKAPEGGMDPTQQGMIAMDQRGAIQAEGVPTGQETPAIAERVAAEGQKPQGLAGLLAEKQAAQATEERKSKPLIAKAQFMTKAKEIFEKHGMVDQAMAIENNYIKHVGMIGHYVSKKAAFKELKQGMFKDSFQDMTEADIEDKGDHFMIEKVGPNNDGIVKFNKKEGTIEIIKEPTAKEETEKSEAWGYGQRKILSGPDKGKIVGVPVAPTHEGGGAAKDEKWTAGKVRQEYNNLNSYLKESENDIIKQTEEAGETPETKARLEKIRNIRQNIMKYRSDDEWSVTESKEAGKYPRNLKNITDYLSGFGGGAAPKKDITEMKPSTGGKKERKALADIL